MNSRAFLGRIVVLGTTATISLLGCLLLSYLSGCNPQEAVQEVTKTVKGVSKDWQKSAADYKAELEKTRKEFKEQSEAWQKQVDQLSKSMVEAPDKLDPVGIKEIYRDNKKLSEINEVLKQRLQTAEQSKGTLLLRRNRLRLELVKYEGSGTLIARLDDGEKAPLFVADLRSDKPILGVKFDIAEAMANEAQAKANQEIDASMPPDDGFHNKAVRMQLGHPNNRNNRKLVKFVELRQSINKRYESLIGKAFDDFLETKQFLSKPPPNHWYLENQLQSAGKHRIRFSIENASPNFFVTVVLNEVSEDGTEVKNLRSFDIDHNTFPDFGTIPPLVVWVRYRPDD